MFEESPPDPNHETRAKTLVGRLGLLGIVLIMAAAFWWTPWGLEQPKEMELYTPPLPAKAGPEHFTRYVGEKACAECHPGEAAAHSRSGHHRTLWPAGTGPVARILDGKRVRDPELPGVEWVYHLVKDRFYVDRIEQGKTSRQELEFGVGSGKHGVSFISTGANSTPAQGPVGLEHRFSYLAASNSLEITPGQERSEADHLKLDLTPFGRRLTADKLQTCLACHATLTSTQSYDTLDVSTMVPNVSCERCHGPGREHVEAARRGETDLKMQLGLDSGEPLYQVALCGECHRLPTSINRSAIHPDNPNIVRLQSVGLSVSRCYQNGLGTLKCTTCHDPHARTSRDQSAYEAVCLSCHDPAGPSSRRVCSTSPREQCIKCHMPKRDIPGGFVFTDHWIGIPGSEKIKSFDDAPATPFLQGGMH